MTAKKEWQEKFLTELAKTGNVTGSCRIAGISKTIAYQYRNDTPAFAEQWKQAIDIAIDALEAAAFKRAKSHSDTLLIFLLKSHRPDVYRETIKNEHDGEIVVKIVRD